VEADGAVAQASVQSAMQQILMESGMRAAATIAARIGPHAPFWIDFQILVRD